MSTTTPLAAGDLDPVTMEVIRMRLDNIVEEMGIAMIRSSGSPVITEAGDFNTALFDASGRLYSISDYIQIHIGSAAVAVRTLIDAVRGEPINPGDAYILNDPHTAGSSHAPDTNVISPIFFDGELVGWAQSQAHLVDVGGITPGGFAPAATDCFGEALRIPPGVKVFERGEPVVSVRRLIQNNVRLPELLWNDVRSLVASNNSGIVRMTDTLREFGRETFDRYAQANFDVAEKVVRGRIAKIPDGVYEDEDWIEHDGHRTCMIRLHCVLTVRGDHATLDFRGSDPQADGFVNCSYGALVGCVASALVPMFCYDTPFNGGVLSAFEILTTPGTVVHPKIPAPTSAGHIETGLHCTRLVARILNKAFAASGDAELIDRCQGGWGDCWTGGLTSGTLPDDQFFLWFNMDGGGTGAGAQPDTDGLDAAGGMAQPNNGLPDVEANELLYPALYLWKRLSPHSAGHGRTRGGFGTEFAYVLHGIDNASQTVFAPASQLGSNGWAGGYPGGGSAQTVLRRTNLADLRASGRPVNRDTLVAQAEELYDINAQDRPLNINDVFTQRISGGGGFGDPLLRDPTEVVNDVVQGHLPAEIGERVYGVRVEAGTHDPDLTARLRHAIRHQRLVASGRPATALREALTDGSAGRRPPARTGDRWQCTTCDGDLGHDDSWRGAAARVTTKSVDRLAQLGTWVRTPSAADQVVLHEWYCPHCGYAVDTETQVIRVQAPVPTA